MNILDLESFSVKRKTGNPTQDKPDVSGLEAMLDYAIVEGAEMRLPLFVFLLRLARLALKEGPEERKPTTRS